MKRLFFIFCTGVAPVILLAQQPAFNPSSFTTTSVKDTVRFHIPISGDTMAVRHLWLFGDGRMSMSDTPVHIYADCGTYMVKHILFKMDNDGAVISSDSSLATVKTACPMICNLEPNFTWKQYQYDPFGQIALGRSSVQFTNTTYGELPKGAKITWLVDGEVGSYRTSPWLHFPYGGYFTICLRITLLNGCVVERCERIGVAEY